MADTSRQTRIGSVLFVDIAGYSRRTVAEQLEWKRACNDVLAEALGALGERDRIILDTGDGAAVTFLGAPENALFVALRASVEKALADLGPVRLISPANPVGDRWVATCEHPEIAVSECRVESLGYTRIVTGPTRQAVSAKVGELIERGAVLVGNIESAGGVWTAVCEMKGHT